MLAAICLPSENSDSGVRIGEITKSIVHEFHCVERLLVGGSVPPDFALHILETTAAKIEQSRKIVWAADVHGVGKSGCRGPREKFSRAQIFGHNVIGVRGCDKTCDRQADALGENSGG